MITKRTSLALTELEAQEVEQIKKDINLGVKGIFLTGLKELKNKRIVAVVDEE